MGVQSRKACEEGKEDAHDDVEELGPAEALSCVRVGDQEHQ